MNEIIKCACGIRFCEQELRISTDSGLAHIAMGKKIMEVDAATILSIQTLLLQALINITNYNAIPSAD